MRDIKFSDYAEWDDRDSVRMPSKLGGESVHCVVSQDYLMGGTIERRDGKKAMSLFNEQRPAIESALRQRIEAGEIERDERGEAFCYLR